MDDEKVFMELQKAVADCKAVRFPMPDIVDGKGLNSDLNKLEPFFELIAESSHNWQNVQNKLDIIQGIIGLQRLLFNRSLWQITAQSLVEQTSHCATIIGRNREEIGLFVYATFQLAEYIERHKLVLDAKDLLARFNKQLQKANPELHKMMQDAMKKEDNDELEERIEFDLDKSERIFSNSPMHIIEDDESNYFVDYLSIFADDFIEQVAEKNSSAQLLIAYSFFDANRNLAAEVYAFATKYRTSNKSDNAYLLFEDMMQDAFNFKLEGVINFSKVFHKLLKYYLNLKIISDKEYRETLKEGNHNILLGILRHYYDFQSAFEIDIEGLEKKIFSNPNHTINAKNARKYLNDSNWHYRDEDFSLIRKLQNPTVKLVVSKKLDDHQLELELKNAQQELENLTIEYAGLDAQDEYELYESFVLQIHEDMVRKYNRRMRRWTKESLLDCLEKLFRNNPEMYKFPSFIRFLEAYIYQLEEDNMISSVFNLQEALEIATDNYLVWGINYLSEK